MEDLAPRHKVMYKFFPHMEKELRKAGVTRHQMWEEFISRHPGGIRRTQFDEHYNKLCKKVNPVMHIPHKAGFRFARENGGNNATKYNWCRKLGSHPDWYNNVYDHNWDFAAQDVQARMPGLQVMFAFQLIGKAAANENNNFNDWLYNGSNWWSGVGQNLAGGGQVNPAGGGQALVNGNPDLYLENRTAD